MLTDFCSSWRSNSETALHRVNRAKFWSRTNKRRSRSAIFSGMDWSCILTRSTAEVKSIRFTFCTSRRPFRTPLTKDSNIETRASIFDRCVLESTLPNVPRFSFSMILYSVSNATRNETPTPSRMENVQS